MQRRHRMEFCRQRSALQTWISQTSRVRPSSTLTRWQNVQKVQQNLKTGDWQQPLAQSPNLKKQLKKTKQTPKNLFYKTGSEFCTVRLFISFCHSKTTVFFSQKRPAVLFALQPDTTPTKNLSTEPRHHQTCICASALHNDNPSRLENLFSLDYLLSPPPAHPHTPPPITCSSRLWSL